jgi:hypothetical protein
VSQAAAPDGGHGDGPKPTERNQQPPGRPQALRDPALRRELYWYLQISHAIGLGLDAWKKAGLPVTLDRSQPIDIIRQVQIVAGSLVLLGVVLGALVAPGFYALSGFVGAGLIFAGSTGFCGMPHVLALMPWNRRTPATAQ